MRLVRIEVRSNLRIKDADRQAAKARRRDDAAAPSKEWMREVFLDRSLID